MNGSSKVDFNNLVGRILPRRFTVCVLLEGYSPQPAGLSVAIFFAEADQKRISTTIPHAGVGAGWLSRIEIWLCFFDISYLGVASKSVTKFNSIETSVSLIFYSKN